MLNHRQLLFQKYTTKAIETYCFNSCLWPSFHSTEVAASGVIFQSTRKKCVQVIFWALDFLFRLLKDCLHQNGNRGSCYNDQEFEEREGEVGGRQKESEREGGREREGESETAEEKTWTLGRRKKGGKKKEKNLMREFEPERRRVQCSNKYWEWKKEGGRERDWEWEWEWEWE